MSATLEQLKQKQTKLEQKLTELEALIKAYEEQEEAEFPKDNDVYWCIEADGRVAAYVFDMFSIYDNGMKSIGNCFRTQEAAEFTAEQIKVIAEMKRCGGVWKTKSAGAREYYLYKTMANINVEIKGWASGDSPPCIWFPTEEAARKAIDTIGEERLMKYWFNVEV